MNINKLLPLAGLVMLAVHACPSHAEDAGVLYGWQEFKFGMNEQEALNATKLPISAALCGAAEATATIGGQAYKVHLDFSRQEGIVLERDLTKCPDDKLWQISVDMVNYFKPCPAKELMAQLEAKYGPFHSAPSRSNPNVMLNRRDFSGGRLLEVWFSGNGSGASAICKPFITYEDPNLHHVANSPQPPKRGF